jgi:hypothetical protein
MESRGTLVCPGCRHPNAGGAPFCGSCGRLLSGLAPAPPLGRDAAPVTSGLDRVPSPFIHLGVGAVLALLLHFGTCGIFEVGSHSFFHEAGGHALCGWLLGIPSIPAITLTHWYDQDKLLAVLVWVAIGVGAWRLRERRPLVYFVAASALVYPFLAFTGASFALVLAAGHLGEIGWAAFFFYRAVRGGAFHDFERPLYAAIAWPLFTQNVRLFFGLATNANARIAYETQYLNEGVMNDFIRFSAYTGIGLARVAALMCLVALVVPPLGVALGYRATRPGSPGPRP